MPCGCKVSGMHLTIRVRPALAGVAATPITADYALALADTAGETNTAKQRRNQVIHDSWQGNRNPFIDHPEWVASIWP